MEPRGLDQLAEEAGFWDARLRSPECTDADRLQFAQWCEESASHKAEFERLQRIAALARQELSRADVRALRDAARRAGSRRRWRAPAAVAAGLALLAIVVAVIGGLHVHAARFLSAYLLRNLRPVATRVGEQYETQLGQRSTVTLRDGSTVELDARTLVNVAFTTKERRIELVCGQALFHVAKNPERPFVVRAGDREIVAIGTEFDVRRDSGSVRVTLIEGRVAVSGESLSGAPDSHRAGAQRFADEAGRAESAAWPLTHSGPARGQDSGTLQATDVILEPGQQSVTQEASGETRVRSVDVQKVIGWRDGRVTMDDFTLAEAVAEMNRHSLKQIRLQSAELGSLRVSGVFRAGEQETFVGALEHYFPITVQRNGDAEIVLTLRTPR
jgi:transmembrane sensor